MIKLVLFDLDGTLLDNEIFTITSKVIEGEKIGYKIEPEIAKKTLGLSYTNSKAFFKRIYGEDFPYDFFRQKRFEYIIEDVKKSGLKLKTGVIELLDYLNQNGIKKAICTSSSKKYLNEYQKYSSFFTNFDLIITGEEITNGKPNPEIFLKAMQKLNIDSKETLVIEDSNNGIVAGFNSKADVIMVPDLVEPNDEVKNLNIKIFKDLHQVRQYIDTVNKEN